MRCGRDWPLCEESISAPGRRAQTEHSKPAASAGTWSDFDTLSHPQGAVRAGLTSLRGDYQRAETELTAQRYAAEEALAARRDSFKTLFEETKTLDVQVRTSLRQRRIFETALRDSSDPVVEPRPWCRCRLAKRRRLQMRNLPQ